MLPSPGFPSVKFFPVYLGDILATSHEKKAMPNTNEHEYERIEFLHPPAKEGRRPPWAWLHRSKFIMVLVLLYSALAISSWTIIAIQVHRPITATSYTNVGPTLVDDEQETNKYDRVFRLNDNWYRGARVLQSIVSALTLPVTSAACARAAVVYAQRLQTCGKDGEDSLTARQVTVLADKGWTDIMVYYRILSGRQQWKRYGTKFLALAMSVSILGLVVQPLQQIFLSSTSVRRPSGYDIITVVDFTRMFWFETLRNAPDDNNIVVTTRKLLETTQLDEVQPMLWSGGNASCTLPGGPSTAGWRGEETPCRLGGFSIRNMSLIDDPFLTQLPNGFNTGLYRQIAPRINSTAEARNISTTEFPAGCRTNGSYYIHYHNQTTGSGRSDGSQDSQSWSVEVCMPVTPNQDYRYSPWTPTRHRQNFTEQLYVRYRTFTDFHMVDHEEINNKSSGYAVQVTVNTTAGFFELPNYGNGQAPGSIMDMEYCSIPDTPCDEQSGNPEDPTIYENGRSAFGSPARIYFGDPEYIQKKGPLLTIAVALFGRGSLIESLLNMPQLYSKQHNPETNNHIPTRCLDKVPFGDLLHEVDEFYPYNYLEGLLHCIEEKDVARLGAIEIIERWLALFQSSTDTLSILFTAAAFLANKALMMDPSMYKNLTLYYDMGTDVTKPDISPAGLIVTSVLLGLQLLALFLITVYACWYPRWTDTLDSFSMMQIGSASADFLELKHVRNVDKVTVLDEVSGRMGEAENSGAFGKLEIGGPVALRKHRMYECMHY